MSAMIQKISALDAKEHINIGTILRKYPSVKLNENKGGVMVNVSTLPEDAIREIEKYLNYLETQQSVLNKIESQTNEYKQYFQ
jgi:hypothetical protein